MLIVEVLVMDVQVSQKCGEKVINNCANLENISRYEYSQSLLHFPDNLVLIGGGGTRSYLSDIEAVSIDDDNINCEPTDLPYKVTDHASVYTPVLDGILTCGGFSFYSMSNQGLGANVKFSRTKFLAFTYVISLEF